MVDRRPGFTARTRRTRPADPLGVLHHGGLGVSPRALRVPAVIRLERARVAAPAHTARQPELVYRNFRAHPAALRLKHRLLMGKR